MRAPTLTSLVALALLAVPGGVSAQGRVAAGQTYRAITTFRFSNVRATMEERLTSIIPWRAHRSLMLTSPAGVRRRFVLHPATNGSVRTSLYGLDNGNYVFLSEFDCLEVDPIHLTSRSCALPGRGRGPSNQICLARGDVQGILRRNRAGRWPLHLGEFDWMNGFDPPHGRFGNRFRYLGPEDALENFGGCGPDR